MRVSLIAILFAPLAASLAFAEEPTSQSSAAPMIVEGPQWTERPTGQDFATNYPPAAARRGQDGRVVLDCTVREDLRLDCVIESETPAGQGFGAASLRAAQRFRMAPALGDGGSPVGGRVVIPMVWRMGR